MPASPCHDRGIFPPSLSKERRALLPLVSPCPSPRGSDTPIRALYALRFSSFPGTTTIFPGNATTFPAFPLEFPVGDPPTVFIHVRRLDFSFSIPMPIYAAGSRLWPFLDRRGYQTPTRRRAKGSSTLVKPYCNDESPSWHPISHNFRLFTNR